MSAALFRKKTRKPTDQHDSPLDRPLASKQWKDIARGQIERRDRRVDVIDPRRNQLIDGPDRELNDGVYQYRFGDNLDSQVDKLPTIGLPMHIEVASLKEKEPQSKKKELHNEDREPQVNDKEQQNKNKKLQDKEKEQQEKDRELNDMYAHAMELKGKREQEFQMNKERYKKESMELENRYEREKELRNEQMQLRSNHKDLWDQHELLLKSFMEERRVWKLSEKELDAVSNRCRELEGLYEEEKNARRLLEIEIRESRKLFDQSKQLQDECEQEKEEKVRYQKELEDLVLIHEQHKEEYEKIIMFSNMTERKLIAKHGDEMNRRIDTEFRLASELAMCKDAHDGVVKELEDKTLKQRIEFEERLRTATDEKEELLKQMTRERQRLSDKNIAQEMLGEHKVQTGDAMVRKFKGINWV